MREFLAALMELTKARITVFLSFSVATGYVLFAERIDLALWVPVVGVFLLACGAAALNQVQDAKFDARMPRTQGRPIPSGRIGRDWALFIAMALIGAGLTVLASSEAHRLWMLGLGALAVVWYNAVYLVLKRWTAFAVVPGSLVGAIPPVIGWAGAGGLPTDPTILEVAFFFFLWQIPHFWLLLIMYGREYEEAGLRSPTSRVSPAQWGRITFSWIVAVAASGLVLAISLRLAVPWNLLVVALTAWLVLHALGSLRGGWSRKAAVTTFLRINAYALGMMLLLSGDALL